MTDSIRTLALPSTTPMQEDAMTTTETPATSRPATHSALPELDRTRDSLLAHLAHIDVHGWDGQPGRMLLTFVRDTVVSPQVAYRGLTGPVAAQAEATAWTMTWRTLLSPGIRDADSPWGILWSAARRAIEDESIAAAYGTQPRKAWQQRASQRLAALSAGRAAGEASLPQLSWEYLAEHGLEPTPATATAAELDTDREAPVLTAVITVLLDAGWTLQAASAALLSIAARSNHHNGRPHVHGGYRGVAAEAGIPGWQARRLVHVLLGTQQWPGLIERVAATTGQAAVLDSEMHAAVRATLDRTLTSPETLARTFALQVAS
jgi:hypothetical protein